MRLASTSFIYVFAFLATHTRYARCSTFANVTTSISVHSSAAPSNQTGLQAAVECWSQWDEYSTASTNCPKTTSTGSTLRFTDKVTSRIVDTFKLCDGHPRAIATVGERTSTSLGEMSGTPYTTYTMVLPPSGVALSTETTQLTTTMTLMETSCASPMRQPTCSIGNDACKALFSSWTAGGFSKLRPPCTYALPKDPCDDCWIYVPSVQLIYFPVSMTGNFCGSYSTVTPTAPVQTTVKLSGTTFTSGTAYLSYAGVTATGYSGICGTTAPAGILPLPSADVSSYRGHAAAMDIMGDIQYPFNFADLAPNPVPWDAWISQETCYTQQDYPSCQTITQAAYRPGIVYPSAFWSLNTQWSNCVSGIFGIVDPPTALQTANQVATPTMPSQQTASRTAAPKQDPGSSGAAATSLFAATGTTARLPPVLTVTGDPTAAPSLPRGSPSRVQGDVEAVFTLDDKAYTVYPHGLVMGGHTTFNFPAHSAMMVAGHTVRMGRDAIWVDSSSIALSHNGYGATPPASNARPSKSFIAKTFEFGTARLTLSGHFDGGGDTILSLGTTSLTYNGQRLAWNGTTYSPIGRSKSVSRTSLPTVVSAVSSTGKVPTIASPTLASNTGPSASTGLVQSSANIAVRVLKLHGVAIMLALLSSVVV